MTLADDIETLRGLRAVVHSQHGPTIDRIAAILEPLAGLSDEQVDRAAHVLRVPKNVEAFTPDERAIMNALATSLTALRGQR